MADPKEPNDEIEDPDLDEENPGQGDVEGGDEAEAGQESVSAQTEEGEVEPRAERARARQDDYRRIAREEAEHRARVERELNDLRSQLQARQQQSQEESEEQFNARMQVLPLEQQLNERFTRSERRHQREILMTRMQAADMADKAAYQSRAASDPRYKRYADQVEQTLRVERGQGRDFPRDTILAFLIGKKVMENSGKVDVARKVGQRNIQRQQVRAGDNRSDRPAGRERAGSGDSVADLERRLEGVFI